MNEKKLTDKEIGQGLEEIKGILEEALVGEDIEAEAIEAFAIIYNIIKPSIDLINRLQAENETLKTEFAKELAEHKDFVKQANDEFERFTAELLTMDREAECYKAEIESLKSKSSFKDSWKNKFFKAQEEVERLTEENVALSKGVKRLKKRYEEAIKQNADECVKKFCETTVYAEQERLVKETTELKKQVDELAKENERLSDLEFTQEHCDLYKENEYLKSCLVLAKQQAVKDTAKEILQDLTNLINNNEDFGRGVFGWQTSDILTLIKIYTKEKRGVEVE